jgi:hypothetical protein
MFGKWLSKLTNKSPKAPVKVISDGIASEKEPDLDTENPQGIHMTSDGIPVGKYIEHLFNTKYEYTEYIHPDKWEPPMKELFWLIIKDRKNWNTEKTKYYLSKYTHKKLDVVVVMDYVYRCGRSARCNLSISNSQTLCIVTYVKVYKEIIYGSKLERILRIDLCRVNRKQREAKASEAKMIADYLESK